MKRRLFYLSFAVLLSALLLGCKSVVYNKQGGNEDVAYLQFISSGSLSGEKVEVVVDGTVTFTAIVGKERKSSIKPNLYTIKPGKRNVKIYWKGDILLEQDIFVSQQKTKTIRL